METSLQTLSGYPRSVSLQPKQVITIGLDILTERVFGLIAVTYHRSWLGHDNQEEDSSQ